MMTAERTLEQRCRRMAERQGMTVRKSPRRDPNALDYGEIWLNQLYIETDTGRIEVVANPEGTDDAWLGPFQGWEELEQWLTADPDTRPDLDDRRNAGVYWLDAVRAKRAKR